MCIHIYIYTHIYIIDSLYCTVKINTTLYAVAFFFFWLYCHLRCQSSPLTLLWEGFLLCGNLSSFTTPFTGWVSIPKSFVSGFIFYILSYLLSKRLGCFSGYLVSSASVQKLFCGSCSRFKWSFDEFLGEKVVSPSYSSTILGLPFLTECCKSTMKVKVTQLCLTTCNPMDYTVHGILQARILEWVAFPFSRRSSQPRNQTRVSCIAGRFFATWATR